MPGRDAGAEATVDLRGDRATWVYGRRHRTLPAPSGTAGKRLPGHFSCGKGV